MTDEEAKDLLDGACFSIWGRKPAVHLIQWRNAWYPQLDQAFYDGFCDVVLCALQIPLEDYHKLLMLNGPHGRTIYKAMMARKT